MCSANICSHAALSNSDKSGLCVALPVRGPGCTATGSGSLADEPPLYRVLAAGVTDGAGFGGRVTSLYVTTEPTPTAATAAAVIILILMPVSTPTAAWAPAPDAVAAASAPVAAAAWLPTSAI